jgi:hypothetical protein
MNTDDQQSETQTSRRGFLRRVGAASALSGVAVTAASTPASADHYEMQPESVTLEFDREWLEQYRPRLDLSAVREHPDDTLPNAMYAWKASSEDYETDVAVFISEYNYQQGIIPTGADSHYLDREPLYVAVDSETGEIQEVVYSAYHWLRGRTTAFTVYEETHPEFGVVSPWHQYSQGLTSDGEFVNVDDLGGKFEEWLRDDEFHDALAPGTVVNPWRMSGSSARARLHWWREGRDSFSLNALFVGSMLRASKTVPGLDFGGASESDL